MKNANKAETSREAKALSVVAKVENKSRAKGEPNAATVERVNGLSGETIGLDVGDRGSGISLLNLAFWNSGTALAHEPWVHPRS